MSANFYHASVGVFSQYLTSLATILSKAAANEELKGVLSGLALEQAMDTIIYKKK